MLSLNRLMLILCFMVRVCVFLCKLLLFCWMHVCMHVEPVIVSKDNSHNKGHIFPLKYKFVHKKCCMQDFTTDSVSYSRCGVEAVAPT